MDPNVIANHFKTTYAILSNSKNLIFYTDMDHFFPLTITIEKTFFYLAFPLNKKFLRL